MIKSGKFFKLKFLKNIIKEIFFIFNYKINYIRISYYTKLNSSKSM